MKNKMFFIFSLVTCVSNFASLQEKHPYLFTNKNGVVATGRAGELGNSLFKSATAISVALDNQCGFLVNPAYKQMYPLVYRNFKQLYSKRRLRSVLVNRAMDYTKKFRKNIRLCGFPHSYLYFDKYRGLVNKVFGPSEQMKEALFEKYKDILSKNDDHVGVHIRTFIRGDDKKTLQDRNRNFYCLPLYYYEKALQHFSKEKTLVIFSDNVHVAKCVVKLFDKDSERKYLYIHINPEEEMYLMSCFKNLILSNSTFAWWGAYFGERHKKIITPSQWYTQCDHLHRDKNGNSLINLPSWIEIPVTNDSQDLQDFFMTFI